MDEVLEVLKSIEAKLDLLLAQLRTQSVTIHMPSSHPVQPLVIHPPTTAPPPGLPWWDNTTNNAIPMVVN